MNLERNLSVLRRRDPVLGERVAAAAPALVIETARSGDPTARRGTTWFHSRYDPAREARRAVEAEDWKGVQAGVVLGLGLGYLLEALAARLRGRPIAACVADPGEARAAFEARDLSTLLSDPSIHWVIGGDAVEVRRRLEAALAPPECGLFRPLPLRPAMEADPAWYRTAVEETGRIAHLHKVSLAALAAFGPLWVSNAVRNLPALSRAAPVTSLTGSWVGRPAAVLGAGPSLDDALPSLARRRGGLVVAVDTALAPCLAAGVRPDLVVAADAQPENLLDFEGLDITGLDLVATHVVDPRTFALPWRRLYGTTLEDPLGRWISEAAGGLGALRTGGSVSTLAFDLVRRTGAAPIVLAGVDLAFGARTHARGVSHEVAATGNVGRFATAETLARAGRRGGRAARDRDGRAVVTSEALAAYAAWLDAEIAAPAAPPVLVAGASILRSGRSVAPGEISALLGSEGWAPPALTRRRTVALASVAALHEKALAGLAALEAAADLRAESGGRIRVEDAAAAGVAEALRALAAHPALDPLLRAPLAPVLDRLDGRTPPDADLMRAASRVIPGLRAVVCAAREILP